jgi:hypothetical protein
MCTKHSCKSSTECGSCNSCNSHIVSNPSTEYDTNDNKIIANSLPTECDHDTKKPTIFLKESRKLTYSPWLKHRGFLPASSVISKKVALKILKQLQKEKDRNKFLSRELIFASKDAKYYFDSWHTLFKKSIEEKEGKKS